MSETQYSAGICNIGEAEIKQRRLIGYIGFGLTLITIIVYLGLVYSLKLDPLFGLIVFIPAEMTTIGLIQARNKFCAAYGFTRQQNVSSRLGLTIKVEDENSHREDRNKAVKIIFQSFIIASIITVLTVLGGIIITTQMGF
ncbi:MAG: hypothetical protein ACXAC8_18010 [Candidatus Hodarchaeales archaeon]|jgi:hypothetical protein